MANPVLHIKDSFYFEVPKFLCPASYRLRSEFPDVWVRLDSDYQDWEFAREYKPLKIIFATSPVSSKDELHHDWRHWQHADHANFAKPFHRFLQEKHEANLDAFAAWKKTEIAKATASKDAAQIKVAQKVDFDDYVSAVKESGKSSDDLYLWFSQGLVQESGRAERWQEAVQAADDVVAYKLSPDVAEWSPAKVNAYNHHLSGKILIPQPFGELRNLYEKESGFAVSRFMLIEVAVALVLVAALSWLGRKVAHGDRPVGKTWNLLETFFVFIRDRVAEPAIGHHDAHGFTPLLATIFFFVLGCNLSGMVPWVGSPTASFSVTLVLAGVTLITGALCGMQRFGVLGYFGNQVPHMDLPVYMAVVLKPMIFAIEMLGLLIKHLVLAIRLLANMFAGHVVLLGIMGIAFGATAAMNFTLPDGTISPMWYVAATLSVLGSALLSILELFVAFLQAYIFTFLSALFIGAAIHHH